MEKSGRFFSFENSKTKIENWCAYRDRSLDETKQKLYSFGLSDKEVNIIVLQLSDSGFLDDTRFAESYVTGKFRIKNWGKKKIYMNLLQKKIDKSLIASALDKIDYDEYVAVTQKLVEKKWNSLEREKDSWKRKQKVIQFLASRGFEFSVVEEAFSNLQL
jgi:regulatory protein